MFGRKLKQENEYMSEMIDALTAQVNILTTRLETQAKLRSAASKKGWKTRKAKEQG